MEGKSKPGEEGSPITVEKGTTWDSEISTVPPHHNCCLWPNPAQNSRINQVWCWVPVTVVAVPISPKQITQTGPQPEKDPEELLGAALGEEGNSKQVSGPGFKTDIGHSPGWEFRTYFNGSADEIVGVTFPHSIMRYPEEPEDNGESEETLHDSTLSFPLSTQEKPGQALSETIQPGNSRMQIPSLITGPLSTTSITPQQPQLQPQLHHWQWTTDWCLHSE